MSAPRGPGGRFLPGQTGNPGGRPKGIAEKAREHGDRALQVLADALKDTDPKVRLDAARALLDRGYGKPVAMSADVTDRLTELDDELLDAAIGALRAAESAPGEARGRKAPPRKRKPPRGV